MPDVTHPEPNDKARFKSYYERTHIPLAKRLPGLKSCSFAYPEALGPRPVPFCIFQAWFDSAPARMASLQSDIGRQVAADVPNYFPNGTTMFNFAMGE
ncbi:MAG: EthD family reductase [Bryobacteraceae bacterium]